MGRGKRGRGGKGEMVVEMQEQPFPSCHKSLVGKWLWKWGARFSVFG